MLVILYLVAIVLANLSVAHFGPGVAVLNAFLFIGLDLTTRDSLHTRWKDSHLVRNMFLLIATGSLLSWWLNKDAEQIAIASFVAFSVSTTVDTCIYSVLHKHPYFIRVNGSNLISAATDSLIFPALAFGFPLLFGIMLGQFIAKVVGGFVWSVLLRWLK